VRQAALALLLAAGLTGMGEAPKGPPAAPARPGDVAIAEELEAARAQGTAAAYELFIVRHPDHPLAAQARRELERLRAR
jgi:hypothetical protein